MLHNQRYDMEVKASNVAYAPINGMPHLAYLGQMLEKEGGFGIGIFPEGLVLSRDCQNESKIHEQLRLDDHCHK